MGVRMERSNEDGPPSVLEALGKLGISSAPTSNTETTGTDTASSITAEGSQSDERLLCAEATEAVTDSDRVTATGNLKIRSKRTERLQRKLQKRAKKTTSLALHLLELPNEVLINIMTLLLPSDIFRLSRTCRDLQQLIHHNEAHLAREIIALRYPIMERCFPLPVPLDQVDPELHSSLQSPSRVQALTIHRRYQHIPVADYHSICTCLSCVIRWNALCNAVDFSYWQTNLEKGDPIPIIPRGEHPAWNTALNHKTNTIVSRALVFPLLYACVMEGHLKNTTSAIKRHSENKGNRRRHFRMTLADVKSETDEFLGREGPSTTDLPFHRDNYYMLEVLMPSRTWLKDEKKWVYMPADLHEKDLEFVRTRWVDPVRT